MAALASIVRFMAFAWHCIVAVPCDQRGMGGAIVTVGPPVLVCAALVVGGVTIDGLQRRATG
jgi:hypothetical protein